MLSLFPHVFFWLLEISYRQNLGEKLGINAFFEEEYSLSPK